MSLRQRKRAFHRQIRGTDLLSLRLPESTLALIRAQGDPEGFIKRGLRSFLKAKWS